MSPVRQAILPFVRPLPGEPSDHMDALMRLLVPAARREIDRSGGFLPFGVSMALDGEVEMLSADPSGSELEQLEDLRALARARAGQGELLAVGVCSDVNVAGRTLQAIRIELEHRDADPVTWMVPYLNTVEELGWGEPVPAPGERLIWPA